MGTEVFSPPKNYKYFFIIFYAQEILSSQDPFVLYTSMNSIVEQLAWILLTCLCTVAVIPPIHAFGYWLQRVLNVKD